MDELLELVQIVTKQKAQSIQIIGSGGLNGTLLDVFYEGLAQNKFHSDEEASSALYGTDEKDEKYRRLKSSLKSRLINTLFFIDVKKPNYTEYQRAFYTCNKEWAAVKILLGKEARRAGIDLAHKVLRQALQFEFTDLIIDVARTLRMHYSIHEPVDEKYEEAQQLIERHVEIQYAEMLAESHFQSLARSFATSKSTKKEVFTLSSRYLNQLKVYRENYDYHNLQLYGFLIEVMKHMSLNDYKATITVCEQAITFFEGKPFVSKVPLATFSYQKLACLTQLKQFEEGRKLSRKTLKMIAPGGVNWFKALELYFILCMHTRAYEEAASVVKKATSHSRFKFLQENNKEIWTIYDAYVKYLYTIGKIPWKGRKQPVKFRMGKFLNEVPIYSKDKRGMNIPILVIQIMFLIVQNNRDEAIDRMEAIRKYCSRHLKEDSNFRSNVFIKMLLAIPACGFEKEAVIKKAVRYFEKLKGVPLEIAYQPFEIEIVPYEDLWEMVVDSLEEG